jgi:hypothetical protein
LQQGCDSRVEQICFPSLLHNETIYNVQTNVGLCTDVRSEDHLYADDTAVNEVQQEKLAPRRIGEQFRKLWIYSTLGKTI